jgi:hypothetical protein
MIFALNFGLALLVGPEIQGKQLVADLVVA